MKSLRLIPLTLASSLFLLACASDVADGEAFDQGGAAATGVLPGTPISAEPYVGVYATLTRSVASGKAPIIGTVRSVSTVVGFAEIRKVDSGFVTVERACHVDTPPSGPQVRLDDAVPRSMPETVSTLSMSKDGTTVHFRRGEVVLVAGSKLDNPESDPLPTSADDPRLFDQDGDGNPGITAHIKAAVFVKGDAYLTQRIRSSHAGTVDAKGVFRGIPRLSAEQSIVGASNPVLKANLALGPEYDAPENLSLLVPVEPGADCDAIMARRAELFGEEP